LRSFGEQSPHFSKVFPKKNATLISRTRDTPNLIEKCSSRAWIAPVNIWHDTNTQFVVGQPISYVISLKNIGRAPALHFNWRIENGLYPVPNRRLDLTKSAIDNADMCEGVEPSERGRTVFQEPGQAAYIAGDGFNTPAIPFPSDELPAGPKVTVTQAMLDGTEAVY
jgi:hypothetical protein